jgi:Zn-dependent protease
MRDPLGWSIPLGRLFGINIRVHWLFPFVIVAMLLREAFRKDGGVPGAWIDMGVVMALLFVSVFLHELGHCFAARWVDGDATDVLMWPLGGLAYLEVPHTPRAHFISTAGGPFVNLVLCLACTLALWQVPGWGFQPPLNPLGVPVRIDTVGHFHLTPWGGGDAVVVQTLSPPVLVAWLFWVNWFLLLLNVIIIGFPLDGGRLFQAILWPYVGYRQSMLLAVFAGFIATFIVGLFGIVMNEVLPLCLAVFIYFSCKQQWMILETGGEESMLGYDFSQGYTSLEREQQAPPKRRQSWWQRWQQRRTARRMQRQQETREAEERRMDELLQKVKVEGLTALTDEERRFLKRVSDRYRNNRS